MAESAFTMGELAARDFSASSVNDVTAAVGKMNDSALMPSQDHFWYSTA